MTAASPIGDRSTVVAMFTLTAVTGLVDAVSYLRLGHVFVANMTGNIVFLGFSLSPHSGLAPATSLIAIGGFLIGAAVGGRAAARLETHARRWLTAAFATEAVVVAAAAILSGVGVLHPHGSTRYATIVMLSFALGVQNSTVRHLGVSDLTTTVLTLTLTGLAADSFLTAGAGDKAYRRLGSVAAMFGGAAAGAALLRTSLPAVVSVAAALVAAVAVAFATARPTPARSDASENRGAVP